MFGYRLFYWKLKIKKKKNLITIHFKKYCSCLINSVPGASPKKKKKKGLNTKRPNMNVIQTLT